ncbi:MAG: Type 1 glutamine amidotransferase-like domain-containing protein [Gaiellaceae bacterium]
MERHIIGLGGGGETPEQSRLMDDYVLGVIGKKRPKVLWVPTAVGDDPDATSWFHEAFAPYADVQDLPVFPWPPANLRELILDQDAICVCGGNTANMLAIWRVHGIDRYLREAWERGIVLWGQSAGMICWFEAGVTDSFGPGLSGMDCLGFLPGSACPHYDGEVERRPRYRALVGEGFPSGVAADDGVALRYVGTDLVEAVTCRPGASAYRVTRDGEHAIDTRELT